MSMNHTTAPHEVFPNLIAHANKDLDCIREAHTYRSRNYESSVTYTHVFYPSKTVSYNSNSPEERTVVYHTKKVPPAQMKEILPAALKVANSVTHLINDIINPKT